jgi:hypothetical protein
MVDSALADAQYAMAKYLRNPESEAKPAGIESRRLKIYQDLVYNNIEGFISSGFPVLRSLYTDLNWHELVREFIRGHRCHSPYFLEISQEFLRFLTDDYQRLETDYPFLAELAHYEWVELALDVSPVELESLAVIVDPVHGTPVLSPLTWLLSYQFPVHQIGEDYCPCEADQPTFLAVYRDSEHQVHFMELNAATARLLELLRDNSVHTGTQLLDQLADELGMAKDTVAGFGADLLLQFGRQSMIYTAQ